MDRRILVVSSATDATSNFVCERMELNNIPFFRFNTEDFPLFMKIHWYLHPNKPVDFNCENEDLILEKVKSVWYRRPGTPQIDLDVKEVSARNFAEKECEVTLSALWQELEVLWVNHPRYIQYATRKPHQLKIASTFGFNIPETILSNNPGRIKDFWLGHDKKVIVKTLHQDAIEIGGENYFAYASILQSEVFTNSKMLSLSPSIFQQYIKPKLELRVTVIGEQVFTAAIDSISAGSKADWRRILPDKQKWFIYKLSDDLNKKCIDLVHHYNLNFGTIDFILSENEILYFLELNANGQWVWIELITGMKMCDEMISLLNC
jgi:glutathione synthase/RimK-type ligase-like ATP-grasp enzyme